MGLLTCPKCGSDNNTDKIEINYEKNCYICLSCNSDFTESESLDYDWERLLISFSEKVTPLDCIEWMESDIFKKLKIQKDKKVGEFGFKQAFYIHFGIRTDNRELDINQIKKQLERETKINKLIE